MQISRPLALIKRGNMLECQQSRCWRLGQNMARRNLNCCYIALVSVSIMVQVFASNSDETRFLGWLGGGENNKMNERATSRFLPASLQVLEHTAGHVNGTWGDESLLSKGARPMFQEIPPLPGLVRLTVLRNSMLAEATALKLMDFDGYTADVETKLQATSDLSLPEQLAAVFEHTVQAGEFKEMETSRGTALTSLAAAMMIELRDRTTDLSRALRQFPSLRYAS